MNTKYNYLIGSDRGLPADYDIDNRPDPDTDGCRELYADIITAFFGDIEGVGISEQKYRSKPLYAIKYKGFNLGSDYIGPSIYWSQSKGLSKEKIIDILNVSRTIGGHIVWPRGGKRTINQARGLAFYDRIDWTLFTVKQFCDCNFGREEAENICINMFGQDDFNKHIKSVLTAVNDSCEWFKMFGDSRSAFKNFCDRFKLAGLGCFIDESYNINWLAPPKPFLPCDFLSFAENNISAIKKRNKFLQDL